MESKQVHQCSPAFKLKMIDLVLKHDIEFILETGTNNGRGSTAIFAELGPPVTSIEVNGRHAKDAREFLPFHVNIIHGWTTLPSHGCQIYRAMLESQGLQPPEGSWGHLSKQILKAAIRKDSMLVFLDSHWTIGFLEFNIIFEAYTHADYKPILVLDDATNLKHKPTLHYLRTMNVDCNIEVIERFAVVTFN